MFPKWPLLAQVLEQTNNGLQPFIGGNLVIFSDGATLCDRLILDDSSLTLSATCCDFSVPLDLPQADAMYGASYLGTNVTIRNNAIDMRGVTGSISSACIYFNHLPTSRATGMNIRNNLLLWTTRTGFITVVRPPSGAKPREKRSI